MASMSGLLGSSQAVLEGTLHLSGSNRLVGASAGRASALPARPAVVRAQRSEAAEPVPAASRRAMLGIAAAALTSGCLVQAVLAEATPIKVGPAPPPSGGLPGTLNSDEPRDLDLKYKERFYLQPLTPAAAAARAKESAQDIVNVKPLIDKKAWPYVQMDLRLKASYLRYDLNTVISAKPKDEKAPLKELTKVLFEKIDGLDYAAKKKSSKDAEKYYAETKSALADVLAKLG